MNEDVLLAQADYNTVPFILIAIVAGYFGYRIWIRAKIRQLDKELAEMKRKKPLIDLSNRLMQSCEKIESIKGTTARMNRCKSALNDIEALRQYSDHQEVITNLDELEVRLHSMLKVFPVIDKMSRAYKHRFAGKANLERSALVEALYAIQVEGVTNEDFIRAEVLPEGARGEIVQIEDIVSPAKQLGWEGPADGSSIPT